MFINFSNHPSKLWAEDERNAALQYGTIEDLAFRKVFVSWQKNMRKRFLRNNRTVSCARENSV